MTIVLWKTHLDGLPHPPVKSTIMHLGLGPERRRRLGRALHRRGPQAALGAALFGLWIVVGTLGYHWLEGWPLLDALYMTVITLTTIGFGEVHPLSPQGRIFTLFLISVGLGTAVYTFTRLGQLVFEGEFLDLFGQRRMARELKRLRDHYIVCGFGRIGQIVARGLADEGEPFCVVEQNPDLEETLRDLGYRYVIGDATEEETLKQAGIDRARAVLALLPTDADNLYLTITAKGLNPGVRVIARALSAKAETNLKKGGADQVVSPYRIAGIRILQAALRPTVLEFMELVTHRAYLPLQLEEIRVTRSSPVVNRTLAEADVRNHYGVIVIAIKRANGEMVFNPGPQEVIREGDILVVMGREEDLRRFEEGA